MAWSTKKHFDSSHRNQLIVGPRRWAYQVLRQTLGERYMVNFTARVFIKDSFPAWSLRWSMIRANANCHGFSGARNRISLHMLRNKFPFATQICDHDHMKYTWTTAPHLTSCKIILVNYNADPLVVERTRQCWVDEELIEPKMLFIFLSNVTSAISANTSTRLLL